MVWACLVMLPQPGGRRKAAACTGQHGSRCTMPAAKGQQMRFSLVANNDLIPQIELWAISRIPISFSSTLLCVYIPHT